MSGCAVPVQIYFRKGWPSKEKKSRVCVYLVTISLGFLRP